MPPKTDAKKTDVKVLKGQEAEDAVLEYIQKMNRPYGAADVAANLKGAIPKTQAAKILASLAEKGSLAAKTYGKSVFYVANQASISVIPAEQLASLEQEVKNLQEENKMLGTQIKASSSELAKIKSTPTDDELTTQISELMQTIQKIDAQLQPLRAGAPLISEQDIEQVDADWWKWRTEWIRRKRIYKNFWDLVTDAMPKSDANALDEELGIEQDTAEHIALERGPLVAAQTNLKRKR
ncbi:TBPIP domain-containing protein [Mycena indigotica]|uniref:TBPIP domain-containing protein n=1 Tax=Mycena indigotica TaxID=2126181 RepID=A0A8H6TB30_9AGAR|nr:TBPIP domain-containing protein [Mycena indigotica]KAF7315238.1 TBPIP domain-containing protein [Mycena indigotica]